MKGREREERAVRACVWVGGCKNEDGNFQRLQMQIPPSAFTFNVSSIDPTNPDRKKTTATRATITMEQMKKSNIWHGEKNAHFRERVRERFKWKKYIRNE